MCWRALFGYFLLGRVRLAGRVWPPGACEKNIGLTPRAMISPQLLVPFSPRDYLYVAPADRPVQ